MKVKFTNDTDARLGFEIECLIYGNIDDRIVSGRNYNNFVRKIRNLKKGNEVGVDFSVTASRPGDYECELRTKPMKPKDAMANLERIFNTVNEFGYTNRSCGFHVNISSKHKTKMKNFHPVSFLSSKLWNEILVKIDRTDNSYCRPVVRLNGKHVSKVEAMRNFRNSLNDKYRCVSLRNFGNGLNSTSRVEIRGFGNKNYTNKFDTISKYIKRIENLFHSACETRQATDHA